MRITTQLFVASYRCSRKCAHYNKALAAKSCEFPLPPKKKILRVLVLAVVPFFVNKSTLLYFSHNRFLTLFLKKPTL